MASKDKVGWAQVWVGLAAAAVAIVAGIFSWVQADQAKQQNIVNEQQALVSLVSAIAQDPQNIAQESGTFKGNPAAVNNAEVGTSFTELTDSEEADYLIKVLNGIGVTAIEYYETGIGLEAGVSDKRALQLLADAVTEAKKDLDPRTLQNAWLAEASIWYQAGNYSNYSQDITQAQEAFSPSLGASLYEYNRNLAYVKLFDASYKAGANRCAIAWKEMNEANNSLKGLNGPSQADSIIMTNIRRDCPRA
jgi:hypothetical protein